MSVGRNGARDPGRADGAGPADGRRPFRAADVLTGSIDRRPAPGAARPRGRKQISAQLEPGQVRLLGELHARLNATAARRIEKSELVGLGIELLAAVLAGAGADASGDGGAAGGDLDPASDRGRPQVGTAGETRAPGVVGTGGAGAAVPAVADADELRAYLRTHVRGYTPERSDG